MTDRELLELAAKAAGIDLYIWGLKGRENFADMSKPLGRQLWNPLTDDGDALRLAVRVPNLNLQRIIEDAQEAPATYDECCAYVRRAIVRAAAEIGRSA